MPRTSSLTASLRSPAAALGLAALSALAGCGSTDGLPEAPAPAGSDGGTSSGDPSGASTTSGATGGPGGGGGGGAPLGPCPVDVDARFDALRAEFEAALSANGVPGGSLAIVCGTDIRAAGLGVVKSGGSPVQSTTRFQLASATKMLTSAAALALDESGTIDLHAPVGAIMPSLGYGGDVTLHHILSHTSGLPTVFESWTGGSLQGLVLANGGMPFWSPPGSVWNYNNYAYAIAGALLEKASGRPFSKLVGDHVFEPIGMTGATMDVADLTGDFAYGHSGGSVLGPLDSYYASPDYGPMGGAWGSAEDMARFAQVLLGHGPLAGRLARQREPYTRTGSGPSQHYGYGLFVEEALKPDLVQHGGTVEGFLASVELVPEAGVAVVALVNADWWFPHAITSEGIEALVPLEFDGPDPVPPSAHWPQLTGTYDSVVFGEIEVRQEGSGLVADFHDTGTSAPLSSLWSDTYEVEWQGDAIAATFWLEGPAPAEFIVSRHGVAQRK